MVWVVELPVPPVESVVAGKEPIVTPVAAFGKFFRSSGVLTTEGTGTVWSTAATTIDVVPEGSEAVTTGLAAVLVTDPANGIKKK